jgi:hypothetical protein
MQIENDYDCEVYNGDIGFIAVIDTEGAEITVRFDERAVTYGLGDLDALVPAYAAMIHKAQGSKYPAVVIPSVAALHHAPAEPALYRHHPRQAVGRTGRQPQGGGESGLPRLRPAALVEAAGAACCVAGWSDRVVTLSTGPAGSGRSWPVADRRLLGRWAGKADTVASGPFDSYRP